jgi:hypothetical protein
MTYEIEQRSRIFFEKTINRPSFSKEPVVSFIDAADATGKTRVNFNEASLEATIKNEEANAV